LLDNGQVDLDRLMALRESDEWHHRHRNRPRYANRVGYLPPDDDVDDTQAIPGSEEKLRQLAARAQQGITLFDY
jgi:hypothetical protein